MFSSDSLSGAVEVLKLGVIGLGFVLAFMAFTLLLREQRKAEPHDRVLKAVYVFMAFSLMLSGLGLYAQMGTDRGDNAMADLERANDSLVTRLSDMRGELSERSANESRLQAEVLRLEQELTHVKTATVNWDYTPNGDKFVCKANGKVVGAPLDCKNHNSCNNRLLNRALCALSFSNQVWQ